MTSAAPSRLRLPFLGLLLAGCVGRAVPAAPAPQILIPTPAREIVPAPPSQEPRRVAGLPPVPEVHGPLKITIAYPDSLARVDVEDSSFVFGSLGDGAASLRINGDSVRVAPNGGWIAWISRWHAPPGCRPCSPKACS